MHRIHSILRYTGRPIAAAGYAYWLTGAATSSPQESQYGRQGVNAAESVVHNDSTNVAERRTQITNHYIGAYVSGGPQVQENVHRIISSPGFHKEVGNIFDKYAAKDSSDIPVLDSRKKIERAFDEACITYVGPVLSSSLGRPVKQRSASLQELESWIEEIKGASNVGINTDLG